MLKILGFADIEVADVVEAMRAGKWASHRLEKCSIVYCSNRIHGEIVIDAGGFKTNVILCSACMEQAVDGWQRPLRSACREWARGTATKDNEEATKPEADNA